jgi:hypothetical protein
MRNPRTNVKHKPATKIRIYGKRTPGLCVDCGQLAQHLYPRPDGSGIHVCYPCKKENY